MFRIHKTRRSEAPHIVRDKGRRAVVGTSGLTNEDYAEIDRVALEAKRGVLAVGNFALTVVLLQKFAEMAAQYIPHWEIIDYAHADKKDAPSGTARELANRLSKIREAELEVPLDEVDGPREVRRRLQGRSPRYGCRVRHFQRCNIRPANRTHSAPGQAQAQSVRGRLLAIREVGKLVGLHRGLTA
jgi:4-hydroxy-tetrahydrodipicolinate reductase